MTREQVKAALPILQAFAEGKTIQTSYFDGKEWRNIADVSANSISENPQYYRIKPEPREFWLAEGEIYSSIERAKQRILNANQNYEPTHVREVIDQ